MCLQNEYELMPTYIVYIASTTGQSYLHSAVLFELERIVCSTKISILKGCNFTLNKNTQIFIVKLCLQSIELTKLCKILGAGFDSDTLTDVLRIIQQHYVVDSQENALNIANTLLQISRNNQIGILSLLMSSEERKCKLSKKS